MSAAWLYLPKTVCDVFNFSVDGYLFEEDGGSIGFLYDPIEGFIAVREVKSQIWHTSASSIPAFTASFELSYSQDGYSGSTGQIPLTRTAKSSVDYYRFTESNTSSPTYKINMPFTDGRSVTFHVKISVNGTVRKDSTFTTPCPAKIGIASVSPSTPQTGKVCTVTMNGQLPSGWTVQTPFRVYAYHNTASSAEYNWYYWPTYINNGTTEITTGISGFTQFQFYVEYISSRTHSDNAGKIDFKFRIPNLGNLRSLKSSSTSVWYEIYEDFTYTYSFTWSYVNQTDSNASPIITLSPVSFTPSDIVTRYGRYVGGGITTLTFGLSVQYRFGGAFQSISYQLYSSGGTLINTWTYTSLSSLRLLLSDTVDSSYYVRVTIDVSNGTSSSAAYSTFNVYGYSYPVIRRLEVRRCNQDGTANDSGAFCRISWSFKVSPLGNANAKTVLLTAPDGSHTFTDEAYDNENGYFYISAADIEHSYAISLSVTDDFQTVSKTVNISTAGVIMDFLYDGKGIGLGKVAETTEMVEVNPQWTFKADKMTFKGVDLETILTSLGYIFPT